MQSMSQQPEDQEGDCVSELNVLIDVSDAVKDALVFAPAKAAVNTIVNILKMIRVSFVLDFRWQIAN